mgnify:CR=1 FL=1
MPTVFIPPSLRKLTGNQERIEVAALSVRDAIAELEDRYPGVGPRLCADGAIKPGLSVAVDGNISSLGLLQKLKPDSELHFLPAIGGG